MKKQDAWKVAALCLSVAAVSSYITWRVVSANYTTSGANANGAQVDPGLNSSKRGDIFTPATDAQKPVEPELLFTKSGRIIDGDKKDDDKASEVFRGTKSAPMISPK